ncbi:MAG: cupin domain-containing protein [Verrucomicrobiota bacterium]
MSGGPHRFEPRTVDKPWGSELIWAETDDYAGKILLVKAGESLSLQYHEVKDESWYVLEGRARLELGAVGEEALDEVEILPGQAFRFRPGTVHRVTGVEDTRILEVSTAHLDDVVRLADSYGREGTSLP